MKLFLIVVPASGPLGPFPLAAQDSLAGSSEALVAADRMIVQLGGQVPWTQACVTLQPDTEYILVISGFDDEETGP